MINKVKLWLPEEEIEESAINQIIATSKHPRLYKHLAIMPDCHAGIGCTIGSVIPIRDALIPSAVGVDIGCGMVAVKTNLRIEDLSDYFDDIHTEIKARIPMGFSHRSPKGQHQDDLYDWLIHRPELVSGMKIYGEHYDSDVSLQLGTLGGGNHFIELQTDNEEYIWIMLHSGSRNIGNRIANNAISLASKNKEKLCGSEIVPDKMEYLPIDSELGKVYRKEMEFALEFAYQNRSLMMAIIIEIIHSKVPTAWFGETINIHHNYAALETHFGQKVWVHRKGATKAVSDQLGIIPGSMGTSSYIVRGKNNADSFTSCSHGAGRTMSRTAAKGKWHRKKKKFTTEGRLNVIDFETAMEGIFTKDVDREHLDESPDAYKEIDKVMSYQIDLVDIVVKLKPVFNIKG